MSIKLETLALISGIYENLPTLMRMQVTSGLLASEYWWTRRAPFVRDVPEPVHWRVGDFVNGDPSVDLHEPHIYRDDLIANYGICYEGAGFQADQALEPIPWGFPGSVFYGWRRSEGCIESRQVRVARPV